VGFAHCAKDFSGFANPLTKSSRVVLQNMRGYPELRYGYHIQTIYLGVGVYKRNKKKEENKKKKDKYWKQREEYEEWNEYRKRHEERTKRKKF
jgi:hypothetical protein